MQEFCVGAVHFVHADSENLTRLHTHCTPHLGIRRKPTVESSTASSQGSSNKEALRVTRSPQGPEGARVGRFGVSLGTRNSWKTPAMAISPMRISAVENTTLAALRSFAG